MLIIFSVWIDVKMVYNFLIKLTLFFTHSGVYVLNPLLAEYSKGKVYLVRTKSVNKKPSIAGKDYDYDDEYIDNYIVSQIY